MALPNGNLLQVIKDEEIKAARAITREQTNGHAPTYVLQKGKEIIEYDAVAKIDDLEIRLHKRVQRFV